MFIAMVIQLREDQRSRETRPFNITNDMKQGCVLAPTLFTLFFVMILKQVTEDLNSKLVFVQMAAF